MSPHGWMTSRHTATQGTPMKAKQSLSWALGLLLAGLAPDAFAEELVFRFEATLDNVVVQPSEGSVAAQAANRKFITGTFGFSTDAAVAANAGIPGRVEFASYDTGFLSINEIDVSRLPGSPSMRVGDGIAQAEDPSSTIKDEVIFSYRAISRDEPIDSLALRFRYRDANVLQDARLPTSFDLNDFDSVSLSFSHRIDSLSNRGEGEARRNQLLGLVHFRLTTIRRAE